MPVQLHAQVHVLVPLMKQRTVRQMLNHALQTKELLWTLVWSLLSSFSHWRTLKLYYMISIAVLWVSVVRCVSHSVRVVRCLVDFWVVTQVSRHLCSQSLHRSKYPWGMSLGGCRWQSCHGYLRTLLEAYGSRLITCPGTPANFIRHHPKLICW